MRFEPAPLGNRPSALTTNPYVLIKLRRNFICLMKQNTVFRKFGGKWGTECPNTMFRLPALPCEIQ